jgi:hypothetical protein
MHNASFHSSYSSPNIKVIKPKRMRLAGRPEFTDKIPKGKDYMGNVGICKRMILKYISRKYCKYELDWINLAQDRNRWRALVNAVTSLFHKRRRVLMTS